MTLHCAGSRRRRTRRRSRSRRRSRRRRRRRRRRLHISNALHFKLTISADFSWHMCLQRHISHLIWRAILVAQCLGFYRPFSPFWP